VLIDLQKSLLSRDIPNDAAMMGVHPEALRRASRVDGATPLQFGSVEEKATEGEGGKASGAQKSARPSRKKLGPQRVNAYQGMCQRRDWASPVY
jgi:hypothetical protein